MACTEKLEIAPEKTRILAFGPMAQQWAKEQGRRKAETFDFLGFTHYCTTSRNGKWFRVGRKTISRLLQRHGVNPSFFGVFAL